MKRKFLSILLTLAMALTLLPTAAMAEGEPAEVPAGEGSAPEYVAQIGDKQYATLQAAVDAAKNKTVKLIADTTENVTISTYGVTLDLNGFTLNGSTGKRDPALTVSNARVTVQDSSAAQTGTIKRDDTAENSGISSHYVIDVQGGSGFLLFKSGNVTNGSGAGGTKGASLVRIGDDKYKVQPTMTIKGGTFTQDNFIALKVDYGTLYVTGGTINSKNSYAVENWLNATIKDNAVVNGNVSSWTYSGGSNSTTTISGGTVNGDVESISYDGTAGKKASVSITGGVVNGTLMTGIYGSATAPTKDMATIEVTSGTFKNDPSKYVVEDSAVTKNEDNTFGVAKAYLAKVGETSYYTMDDAFKAQTASGEAIVLLRDYTTGSPFNSGSINRTVDLNGHTWTCTGTGANSAAFEINYANASLTVKNGKIVSSQLVGLIPSAMGGTIKYDNSSLTFENVEMSTTATSGIETNGNNTNDTVTLINSTLNVPNGFGIYFPSSGTLTIDNSTINAKTMGVQVCAGSLNINDGSKITVSGDAVPKTENDGAIQDGAAISIVNRSGYKGLDSIAVTGGSFKAKGGNAAIKAYDWDNDKKETAFTAKDKVSVSGGYFTSDPTAYLAAGKYVIKSDKAGYTHTVTNTKPAEAPVFVQENTEAKHGDSVSADIKNQMTTEVLGKTEVNGVADAVNEDALLNKVKVDVTDNAVNKVDVEVKVDVQLTGGDLSDGAKNKTLTFEASPVATIKVNNVEKATNVKVSNSMLNGKAITVKLPLPAGFNPEQIKHISSDGSVEYFLKTAKRGANTFEIKDGCAVFTITKFSTFELSGTVTYVAPSSGGGSSSSSRRYDVSAPSVKHGDVTVSPKRASKGDTVTITVKPDSGYELDTLTVKDVSGSKIKVKDKGDGKVTFTMPASKVTVSAEFAEIETLDFADVSTDAYYYEAVKWAAKKGITGGTGDGTFNPNGACTRAHIVTFLWRAAGSPAPKSTVSFADVPAGSYYAKAVAWAVENGITLGTGDGTFSPNATCTRAQSVTFLYRALGTAPTTVNGFTDVTADAFYADAVAWAVESGVTNGTSASTFSPNNGCTRAQIVTFLYRTMK